MTPKKPELDWIASLMEQNRRILADALAAIEDGTFTWGEPVDEPDTFIEGIDPQAELNRADKEAHRHECD